jgi:hypothetical protein
LSFRQVLCRFGAGFQRVHTVAGRALARVFVSEFQCVFFVEKKHAQQKTIQEKNAECEKCQVGKLGVLSRKREAPQKTTF